MREWPFYGGDQGGTKYSTLININRNNVHSCKWHGSGRPAKKRLEEFKTFPGMFEVTPVMAAGTLYLSTPTIGVVRARSRNGARALSYDLKRTPMVKSRTERDSSTRRGSVARTASRKIARIHEQPHRLISRDAETGLPAASFGDNGTTR